MGESAVAISSKLDQDVIDRSVNNAAAVINARIDGMALAVEVFQADLHRVPTAMDRAVLSLRELLESKLNNVDRQVEQYHDISRGKIEQLAAVMGERFTGVAAQFSERDTRTDQRAGDTKLAVDAAFAAAKEATAKIEAGFTKQIDAIISIIDTKTQNLASGLGDLKERIAATEARTIGISSAHQEIRHETNDNRGLIFGILGSIFGLFGMLIAAAALLHGH